MTYLDVTILLNSQSNKSFYFVTARRVTFVQFSSVFIFIQEFL